MKKILVISNTAFSIKKFREHYLGKCKNYKFKIYTPNEKVKLNNKTSNIETCTFSSKNLVHDFFEIKLGIIDVDNYDKFILHHLKWVSNLKENYGDIIQIVDHPFKE